MGKYLDRSVHQMMDAKNVLGVRGITVFDSENSDEMEQYNSKILGFEQEDPVHRALANIATRLMSVSYEDDIGIVVDVRSSDAADYGAMIHDVMAAETEVELREAAAVYGEMPGAKELLEVCASKLGVELRLAC